MTDQLTEQDMQQIAQLAGYGSQENESKKSVYTFLDNVAKADDTTKLGNLSDDEVGQPGNPIRVYKKMALFAGDIMENSELKDYFNKESEIVTSTSLSKEALLLRLAVTQKKELADVTQRRKENKSWFKKKDKNENEE